jgi:hypothetical protein
VSETSVQGWSVGGKSHGIHRYFEYNMQFKLIDNQCQLAEAIADITFPLAREGCEFLQQLRRREC